MRAGWKKWILVTVGLLAFWTCAPAGIRKAGDALNSVADVLEPDATAAGETSTTASKVVTAATDINQLHQENRAIGASATVKLLDGPMVLTWIGPDLGTVDFYIAQKTTCDSGDSLITYGSISSVQAGLFVPAGAVLCVKMGDTPYTVQWSGYVPYQ